MKNPAAFILLAIGLLMAPTSPAAAQPEEPRASLPASVSQTVGFTEITVVYHRPRVKGREIWGDLVPYGEVWRTGANENTTIEFSTAVEVEGQHLGAGKYGLHTIPGPDEWTIIFSNVNDAWGSFDYTPEEDALRVSVVPEQAPHMEAFLVYFPELTDTSTTLALHWEKVRVPVRIDVEVPAEQ